MASVTRFVQVIFDPKLDFEDRVYFPLKLQMVHEVGVHYDEHHQRQGRTVLRLNGKPEAIGEVMNRIRQSEGVLKVEYLLDTPHAH